MNRRLLIPVILLGLGLAVQPFSAAAQAQTAAPAPIPNADTALLYGDYDSAIAEYTNAMNDPSLRCSALYGLGVTYLRSMQYENADSSFSQYLGECETSYRALIMRGEVREALDRDDEALADYQQAMSTNPGLLDSYLYERMAALDTDASVLFLRLAADAAERHPEALFELRRQLADVYLLVGSPEDALAQYDALLQGVNEYRAAIAGITDAEYDENGELRAAVESSAAEIEIENGRPEAGYARLQRVITDYWETSSALPALITLVNASQPVDMLARMRINVRNENFTPVVSVLTDYLDDPNNAAATGAAELHVLLGRAQRGEGDMQAALATFDRVRQQFPDDLFASTAALEQAETYAQMGDTAQALAAFNQVAATYPQSPEAPAALLRAAQTERDSGNAANALTLYAELSARYAGTEQAEQGADEAAELAPQVEPAQAAELYGRIGTAEGYVWQGKLLQQAGNTDGARAAWQQATAADPGTFFAMRACELLNERQPFTPSTTLQVPALTAEDIAAAEQWVAQRFGLQSVSAQLSPELASNPMLRRGVELWAVGMWDEARSEFDALHKLMRDDPAGLLQLAVYYQSIPVYRSSVYAATRLAFMSEVPFTQIPRAILQLAYPFYYMDLIATVSAGYELDPLLMAALIRQETSFDATATSFAGAQGLMQFMPATAQDVADRLGQADYDFSDLNRPVVSVLFGAYYLDSMRDFQGGSIPGALLSYNAGPGAAQQWVNAAGGDLERLYQIVHFDETQLYLEIIYENYTVYQHLYGGGVPTCMFEGVQT